MMQLLCSVIFMLTVSFTMGMEMNLSPEEKQKLLDMHNACVAETSVSADSVAAAMAGEFPEDPVLKEHIFCMSKKLGFQNEDGKIQMDKVSSTVSKYVSDPIMAEKLLKCEVERDTPQNTAYEVAKCAYQIKFGMA